MRQIGQKVIDEIHKKAKELNDLLNSESLKLVAVLHSDSWDVSLELVPSDVQMGETSVMETEPIDLNTLKGSGLYATVLDCEINDLYELENEEN